MLIYLYYFDTNTYVVILLIVYFLPQLMQIYCNHLKLYWLHGLHSIGLDCLHWLHCLHWILIILNWKFNLVALSAWGFFETSRRKVKLLNTVCDAEYRKVLQHINTRWLSMEQLLTEFSKFTLACDHIFLEGTVFPLLNISFRGL